MAGHWKTQSPKRRTRAARLASMAMAAAFICRSPRAGTKSWIFRYWVARARFSDGRGRARSGNKKTIRGRAREMGLGSYITVTLAEARDRAWSVESSGSKGSIRSCPRTRQTTGRARAGKVPKIQRRGGGLYGGPSRRLKERQACSTVDRTLKTYAYPVIGDLPLHLIDTTLVMKVIEPLWSTKPETASRLRGRMEVVLDWAPCAATATVKIRRAGAAIWKCYCRRGRKCARRNITVLLPTLNFRVL